MPAAPRTLCSLTAAFLIVASLLTEAYARSPRDRGFAAVTPASKNVDDNQAPAQQQPPSDSIAPPPAAVAATEGEAPVIQCRLDSPANQAALATRLASTRKANAGDDQIQVEADDAELLESGISEFRGDVRVDYQGRKLSAEKVEYSRENNQLRTDGPVKYDDGNAQIRSNGMQVDGNQEQASFGPSSYRINSIGARGTATSIEIDTKRDQAKLNGVAYTTCPANNEDWKLAAGSVEIDNQEGMGTARNARLYFKGVPFIYFPYLSFPIDGQRKTGFLVPTIGSSGNSGFDLSLPWYWNIAPNYDATLTPRLLTSRGLMLSAEGRIKLSHTEAKVNVEALPNDRKADRNRTLLKYQQESQLAEDWELRIDSSRVSDSEYFTDFGSSLASSGTSYLRQQAQLNYYGDWLRVTTTAETYQVLDDSVIGNNRPYRLLPSINFDGLQPLSHGWEISLTGSATHFDDDSRVAGTRVDFYPKLSWRHRRPGYFIEPSIGWRSTLYWLENSGSAIDNQQSRHLPIYKVDAGLVFEREFQLFELQRTQTFEPRIQYLQVPFEDQDNLPLFDTDEPDFNMSRVFAENRFIGGDRVSDARRVAIGFTSRFLRPSNGEETARLQIARTYDTQIPSVEINPNANRRRRSDVLTHLRLQPTLNWRANIEMHYAPQFQQIARSAVQVGYYGEGRIVNVGYRRRVAPERLEQSDISFAWDLNERWSTVGRWNYSLRSGRTLESLFGLEYGSCCYVARVAARRFREVNSGDLETRIFFELELRGLTAIGNQIDRLLERGILGYSR